MSGLTIADFRLLIAELFSRRGFMRSGHDGGQFVGFLKQGGQFSRRHDFRFHEQFEPQRRFIGFFFDDSDLGDKLSLTTGATTGAVICRDLGAATDDLAGDNASGIVVSRNRPGQLDNPQGKGFGTGFQFVGVHGGKLQTQSAISNQQSAIQR